jgi:uncharacterized protein YuzE
MKIDYDEKEDILFIQFSDQAIIKDISYGWNVNVGITANGIGQISVLGAKASGLLPLQVSQKILADIIRKK